MKASLIRVFQKVLVRPGFVQMFEHVYKLSLRGMGVLNSEGTDITGERWVWQKANEKLNIRTVVDVGANDGGLMNEMSGYFTEAEFFGLEPNPETYIKLENNIKNKTKVNIFNKAVSDKAGKMILYDFSDDAPLKSEQPTATMASVHKAVIEDFHEQPAKEYSVQAVTLDGWVEKEKIKQIDWLVMDVEGHELSVLQGAKKLIQGGKIGVVQFEFNEMNAYSGVFLRDFMEMLKGYSFFRLLPQGLWPLSAYRPLTYEIFGFQNIVAVREDWVERLIE